MRFHFIFIVHVDTVFVLVSFKDDILFIHRILTPASVMACLLRAVSRTGTELMVKNSSLIPRSLPGVSAASLQQSRCLSSEEKAAQKAAKKAEVQAALGGRSET